MSILTAKDEIKISTKAQIPETMKAVVFRQFGGVEVLRYEDIEIPRPKPGNILIKVLAAGVNRLDHYIREGSVVPQLPFPHILGADAVGEVVELGPGVTNLKMGERVIPSPGFSLHSEEDLIRPLVTAPSFALPGLHIWGTYAQYMEVPARWVEKDDTGLSHEEVASLPVVLATSVRAVKEVGEVKAGDKVLIHAGASGSGSMQIQVAKALGAEVGTTVRSQVKGAFAKSLGADLIINTRDEDFVERIKDWTGGQGVDVAIDNLAGDVLPKTIDAVRPLGTVVAYGFAAGIQVTFDITKFYFAQKRLRGSMASDPENLRWGLEQVRAGWINPTLDRTLPLSQAAEAHRLISTNQISGNIVLLPWEE